MVQQGIPENPTITDIKLYKGYNWIGYLPTTALHVADALSNLSAAKGDRLISQNGFTEYGDNGWEGQLTEMTPGVGYMYHRNADATTFRYAEQAADNTTEAASEAAIRKSASIQPWSYDIHKYPDVTTIIAKLYMTDEPAEQGRYTVGAFSGDECRGIGTIVGEKLFITVHGTVKENETITFRAYDETSGETLTVSETIVFQGQSLGNLDSPLQLHAQLTPTGINGISTMSDIRTIHTTGGNRLSRLQQGVNIVTKTDGSTVKVVVE